MVTNLVLQIMCYEFNIILLVLEFQCYSFSVTNLVLQLNNKLSDEKYDW